MEWNKGFNVEIGIVLPSGGKLEKGFAVGSIM